MISFVIPALNEQGTIGRCIDSIQREIAVTGLRGKSEIIVVDNGSWDLTAVVAEQHGARVVTENRRGILSAKQAGFECARYPIVAFIDADCTLRLGWLSRVVAAFDDPEVVAVSGPYLYDDIPLHWRVAAGITFFVFSQIGKFTPVMMGGNSVLRRDVLERLGGFDVRIRFWGEDTATARAFGKFGKVVFDFGTKVNSSGRRFRGDGYVKTFVRYIRSYFAVRFGGVPDMVEQTDYR